MAMHELRRRMIHLPITVATAVIIHLWSVEMPDTELSGILNLLEETKEKCLFIAAI